MNLVLAVTGVASASLAILGICVVIGVHRGDRVRLGSVPAGSLARFARRATGLHVISETGCTPSGREARPVVEYELS